MTSHQEWQGILLGRFLRWDKFKLSTIFYVSFSFSEIHHLFCKMFHPNQVIPVFFFFQYIKAKTLASAHIYIFIHISHMVFFSFFLLFQTKKEERNTLYIFHLTLFCLVQLAESRHQIYSNIFFHTYLFSKFLYVIRYKKSYVISVCFCYVVYQIFFFATSIK